MKKKTMDWGGAPESECDGTCLLPLVAAGRMRLQQNLPSDREILSKSINEAHAGLEVKRARLDERVQVYLEAHNVYKEKQEALIETANSPANVDMEGKVIGWDRLSSDSPAKRTKAKLDQIEAATISQLERAKYLLEAVVEHDRLCVSTYSKMDGFAGGYEDFTSAVDHARHICQAGLDNLKQTLSEHSSDHGRFLSRIANVRSAIKRGVTASI